MALNVTPHTTEHLAQRKSEVRIHCESLEVFDWRQAEVSVTHLKALVAFAESVSELARHASTNGFSERLIEYVIESRASLQELENVLEPESTDETRDAITTVFSLISDAERSLNECCSGGATAKRTGDMEANAGVLLRSSGAATSTTPFAHNEGETKMKEQGFGAENCDVREPVVALVYGPVGIVEQADGELPRIRIWKQWSLAQSEVNEAIQAGEAFVGQDRVPRAMTRSRPTTEQLEALSLALSECSDGDLHLIEAYEPANS